MSADAEPVAANVAAANATNRVNKRIMTRASRLFFPWCLPDLAVSRRGRTVRQNHSRDIGNPRASSRCGPENPFPAQF
jgi:hypothetical protein